MPQESGSFHTVNLSQDMKEPIIYLQQNPDQKYLDAIKKGFKDPRTFNSIGLYGGACS